MTVNKKTGFKQMVAEAEAKIDTLSVQDAMELVGQDDVAGERHLRAQLCGQLLAAANRPLANA